MDYATYRQFRDKLPMERSLLRLDCMNPAKALASFLGAVTKPIPEQQRAGVAQVVVAQVVAAQVIAAQVMAAWSKATRIALDPERIVAGRGVRELLAAIFSHGLKPGDELWLPADVYPVYWELAKSAGLRCHAFPTLPQPDWNFLARAGEQAALVLPVPLSPLGRFLVEAEAEALVHWLGRSRRRQLIVDAVYTFDFSASRHPLGLFFEKNEQCMVLWSCSKSWLSPGCLGLAAVPRSLAATLQNQISAPAEPNLGRIHTMLEEYPDFPRFQQEAFDREWRRLAPCIRKAVPEWQPPASGYFSVVSSPFETLLEEHGILSVPASVFRVEARRDDLSILTCLHDLVAHERGAQAS